MRTVKTRATEHILCPLPNMYFCVKQVSLFGANALGLSEYHSVFKLSLSIFRS